MEQTGKAFLRSSRHAALLALCYFAAVMIPNCILFFTEPYSIWSKAALLTLPAGGYLGLAGDPQAVFTITISD